jgi:hypothetical protein
MNPHATCGACIFNEGTESCGEEDSEEKACELLDLLRDKTMRVVLTLYEMEAEQQ